MFGHFDHEHSCAFSKCMVISIMNIHVLFQFKSKNLMHCVYSVSMLYCILAKITLTTKFTLAKNL